MPDNVEPVAENNLTFKVKSSADKVHTITMSESATVLDLKTILSGDDYEKVPANRQRLIYSGRVMKDADQLATYKIKNNNTVHMVKSAASNQTQPTGSSSSTPQAVPSNMASGTANNPLAGLTGARYAGHQINLPGLETFGPDGGMGPPMDEERLTRLMADPNVQQSMNEALNNPDFVNMLIESNPMLRGLPNARELITSPFMRQMMSNPQMMGQAMRLQRTMGGQNSAFPAPGATDTTPADAAAAAGAAGNTGNNNNNQNPSDPFANNPVLQGLMGGLGGVGGQQAGGRQPNLGDLIQQLQSLNNLMTGVANSAPPPIPQAGSTTTAPPGTTQAQGNTRSPSASEQPAPAPNPFMALFGGDNNTANPNNAPFGYDAETMQRMLQMFGGSPPAPPDNRPPEERYAEQLRQLNDMGFFDFDRNVAALRRSGGSVQGAIEHLLNPTD